MTPRPNFFTHVHQGIRRALFEASTALGRALGDPASERAALELLDDALLFVTRHGQNEDVLLLPLLTERAPELAERMRLAHDRIELALQSLQTQRLRQDPELYLGLSSFIALYLEHMAEEELELAPAMREVITDEELAEGSRQSVARTDPLERTKMLALMLPALPLATAREFLSRLPAETVALLAHADSRLRASPRAS